MCATNGQVIKIEFNPQEPFTLENPQDLTTIYPKIFDNH